MKRITPLLLGLAAVLASSCTKRLEQENSDLRIAVENSRSAKAQLEITLATKSAENDALKQRTMDLEATIAQLRDEIAALRKDGDASRTEMQAFKLQIGQLTVLKDLAEKKVADADAERLRNQKGILVGSVSYFFNQNYGYKPDSGAKIYIFRNQDVPELKDKIVRYLNLKNDAIGSDASASAKQAWDVGGSEFAKYLVPLLFEKPAAKLQADGSGAFSMKLAPGKYSVLVKSAHREAMSVAEVDGALRYFETEIRPDDQANIAAQFYLW